MQLNQAMRWAVLSILGGATMMSVGCKKEGAKAAEGGPMAVGVKAVPADQQDVPVYLDQIGRIVSTDMVSIVPQVGGKLIKAHIEDGADVKKGQLLFEIDPRPYEAAVAIAKGNLAQAKADLALSETDFKRVEGLKGTSAISQQEIDTKESQVAINKAKLEGAEASLASSSLDLEYTKIYAPIDGRAGARLVVPGNVVKANEGTILVIQKLDPIYAEFTVPENDLGTVRKYLTSQGLDMSKNPEKGLKVLVDMPGDSAAMLNAMASVKPSTQPSTQPTTRPSGARQGTLTFLDNSISNSSGTVRIRATVPNSDYYFWPGQFVNCRVILTTKKDAVLVPQPALQISQQGSYVYVINGDKADMRVIKVGQRHGESVVVEEGVKPGEKVIVAGQMLLQPGAQVQEVPDAPPAQGKPPEASSAKSEEPKK